ncbi:TIGR03364 family FAD-dependent oxidoreductase [Microbacterium karelineae]|uniref:TIGR03364 family FAD-dependent oxidoreductase n=1 Tax=Microbacterium karelineae TaxID=2654283 RepID=UPI0012E9FC0A|nr:TIGR03364 family FAD-dependent oxidoreductase [Microbacterium karelineae]
MKDTFDVAVVGAGIVGLAHAAAAHARGLRTVVIDRADRISGATVRNFGHIGTTMQVGEGGEYARRARELFLAYAPRAGFWLARRGTLMVATAEDEMQMLREIGEGRLLSEREVTDLAPVSGAIGGALLKDDMQVNPRDMGPRFATWLEGEGVSFRWRESAMIAEDGVLYTSRGTIRADNVVFCVGHDVDHVLPEVAERHGVERCALDMALAGGIGLEFPVLTGSSMLRYSAFRQTAAYADLLARFQRERPDMLDFDVNQMYTEAPGMGLFLGDSHRTEPTAMPFQDEHVFGLLAREARRLFGLSHVDVRERWQGVYAKAPEDFLRERVADGVWVSAVTTGIGMTTGLGLGESVIDEIYGSERT